AGGGCLARRCRLTYHSLLPIRDRSMSMSLREQLLAAGLGKKKAEQDERTAKEHAERRAKEQQRLAQAQAAQGARQAEKAGRAQALQQRRQEEADRKERWTKIKQLIEQHRLPKL